MFFTLSLVTSTGEAIKDKEQETGSQAISALKKLSAKVGILGPKTVQSKHLSALEQLNKRVGSVALETVNAAPSDLTTPEKTTATDKVEGSRDAKGSEGGDSQPTTGSPSASTQGK